MKKVCNCSVCKKYTENTNPKIIRSRQNRFRKDLVCSII